MGLAALPVNNPPRYPTNTPEPITWKIIQRKNEGDREGLFHCPICQVTLPLGPLCKHWVLSALKNSGYGNREARPLPGHLRSITYTYMMTPCPLPHPASDDSWNAAKPDDRGQWKMLPNNTYVLSVGKSRMRNASSHMTRLCGRQEHGVVCFVAHARVSRDCDNGRRNTHRPSG